MSYILDALRKAERERGMQKVPTLMTEHAPRHINSKNIWFGISAIAACTVAIAGYFMLTRPINSSAPLPITQDGAPAAIADARENETTQEGSHTQSGDDSRHAQDVHKSNTLEKAAATSSAPRIPMTSFSRAPTPEQALPNRLRAIRPDDEELPDNEELDDIPPPEIQRSLPQPGRGSAAPPVNVQSQPLTLKESVARMNLSLLVTSANKEERMVYIDGKKYQEGDNIDGIFRIESITEKGAVISYQEERALLQPRSK